MTRGHRCGVCGTEIVRQDVVSATAVHSRNFGSPTPLAMSTSSAEITVSSPSVWYALASRWLLLLQLTLALGVIYVYDIEGPALFRVMTLATVGFAVSVVIPKSHRLPFFILLSFTSIFAVLGLQDGAFLIASGFILIGICNLRVRLAYRTAGLLVVAILLATLRTSSVEAFWSSAVWPILGSMFMFRLVLYLRASASKQVETGWQSALAYFFMLPNVAFPLFPVVDYQTFRQTHFDREDNEIYERGLLWISRGLVHLILYRLAYQNIGVLSFGDFYRLSDVVQWMLGTILLYLRVSGQFHLIIGILHLFGFRLPETHKQYFLSHGFTELWRRMNIYWTTFMTNVVFYPTYFRVKRFGPAIALGVSTAAVFVATWILHSYQWFWLQGTFPIRLQDVLFWGILGILVIRGVIKEHKAEKKLGASRRWDWRYGIKAACTFSVFCVLWSLWSTASLDTWIFLVGVAGNVDSDGLMLVAIVLAVVVVLGAHTPRLSNSPRPKWLQFVQHASFRSIAGLVILLLAAQPWVREAMPGMASDALNSLVDAQSSARDSAVRNMGYYEQLDFRGPVDEVMSDMECAGEFLRSVKRSREDHLDFDLKPSLDMTALCWGSPKKFTTNSLGMRDGEYVIKKPGGTLRVAILGPSFTTGWGVADGETYEQLVEERLNRDFGCSKFQRFEILNFSVPAHSLPHELALLEDRVFEFSPDIVIMTVTMKTFLTAMYLSHVASENVVIPYESVNQLLNQSGLRDGNGGSVAVPFHSWRTIAQRIGVETRIPAGESYARGFMIADQVNEWTIRRFGEVTLEHGAKPILMTLDDIEDDMSPAAAARTMVQKSGLPVIDMFDVYPQTNRHALWAARWDSHPNAAGHRMIADKLYDELVPFIQEECRRSESNGV